MKNSLNLLVYVELVNPDFNMPIMLTFSSSIVRFKDLIVSFYDERIRSDIPTTLVFDHGENTAIVYKKEPIAHQFGEFRLIRVPGDTLEKV